MGENGAAQLQAASFNGTLMHATTMAPLRYNALLSIDILTKAALKLYTQQDTNITRKKEKDNKCNTKGILNSAMTNSGALTFD